MMGSLKRGGDRTPMTSRVDGQVLNKGPLGPLQDAGG